MKNLRSLNLSALGIGLLMLIVWACKKDSDSTPKPTCNQVTPSGFSLLATDTCSDGFDPALLDGTQLFYRYDGASDSLWFIQAVNAVSASQPIGINVMVKIPGAGTGFNFWGIQNQSAFHRLLTVWVTGTAPSAYTGTIGIGDSAGVEANMTGGSITNLSQNNIRIVVNTTDKTILLGLKRSDLIPDAFFTSNTLAVGIASAVGSNAAWNDDVFSASATMSITTVSSGTKPTLTTSPTGSITSKTVLTGGSISSDGGKPVTERGVCWSTTQVNPTVADSKKAHTSAGDGDFSLTVTNLAPNTTYFLRAYATNANGTAYGNGVSFVTKTGLEVVTGSSSSIAATSFNMAGNVTNDGGSPVTERGMVWSTSAVLPTLTGNRQAASTPGSGSFSITATGLSPTTSYFVSAYAITAIDTAFGVVTLVSTLGPPSVATNAPDQIVDISCMAGGNVTSDGGAAVTARGFVVSTLPNPTLATGTNTNSGSGTGAFQKLIFGLSATTTYHIRAYATNTYGTGYGQNLTFTTLAACTPVTDIDGNTYPVVRIGSQCWMKENLKTLHYKNGTNIPVVPDQAPWSNLTTPAVCTLSNNAANVANYGLLYNWYVANQNQVCPTGWHVPTTAEWTTLINHLGGANEAGGKMKVPGFTWWYSPNLGASNSSGFSALGAGYRENDGNFYGEKDIGVFWAQESSEDPLRGNRTYLASYDAIAQQHHEPKKKGMSIRCVKD